MITLAALSFALATYLMFPMPGLAVSKQNPKIQKSKVTNPPAEKVTNEIGDQVVKFRQETGIAMSFFVEQGKKC